jgi:hypothetical protein
MAAAREDGGWAQLGQWRCMTPKKVRGWAFLYCGVLQQLTSDTLRHTAAARWMAGGSSCSSGAIRLLCGGLLCARPYTIIDPGAEDAMPFV